jgi:hypothetical protein
MCRTKIAETYKPIKLIRTEPVIKPTKVFNIPTSRSIGDNAEAYNFKIHKAGAGQCKRRKSRIPISAATQPETAARI